MVYDLTFVGRLVLGEDTRKSSKETSCIHVPAVGIYYIVLTLADLTVQERQMVSPCSKSGRMNTANTS